VRVDALAQSDVFGFEVESVARMLGELIGSAATPCVDGNCVVALPSKQFADMRTIVTFQSPTSSRLIERADLPRRWREVKVTDPTMTAS
jgi:hypothetical protein